MNMLKKSIISIILLCIIIPFVQPQNDAKYYYEKGQEKFASGDFKEAADQYMNARSMDDSLVDAWYGEARSYFKLGQYDKSYGISDQVLNDPSFDASDLERFGVLAGDSSIENEKIKGVPLVAAGSESGKPIPIGYLVGLRYYDNATKLNPNSTKAWNNKGIALADLGNYTGSINCFERAIEINSSLAEAYNNKGASLDNLGSHSEALKCYDNATKLDPLLAEAWYNRAKTLAMDMNSFSQAKESYKKATELNPGLKGEQLAWIYARLQ